MSEYRHAAVHADQLLWVPAAQPGWGPSLVAPIPNRSFFFFRTVGGAAFQTSKHGTLDKPQNDTRVVHALPKRCWCAGDCAKRLHRK